MLVESVKGGVTVEVWGRNPYGVESRRFEEWLFGWLASVYEVSKCYDCVGFRVNEEDIFKLFEHMYREVEIMKKLLGDGIVAICKEYYNNEIECIDISEVSRPMVIITKDDIERLKKVRNEIKVWIDEIVWIPVEVDCKNGLMKIGRCELPVDEALYVVEKVLDELFKATGFKKLLDYKEEIRRATLGLATYLPKVDTWHGLLGIGIRMDGCGFTLENNEALILVYNILTKAVEQLEKWREEWEEMKTNVKTLEEVREKKEVEDEENE
jgi:prefoldin subunit 5